MTAQDLKNSILQLAVQGKLVSQRKTEASVDLSGLKQKKQTSVSSIFQIAGDLLIWKQLRGEYHQSNIKFLNPK